MTDDFTPPWDQETTLERARSQIRVRVDERAAIGGRPTLWLAGYDVTSTLAAIERLGADPVIGSEMALWRWPTTGLTRLSELLRRRHGLLVFLEPTAGLGLRRAMQLPVRRFRRDVPAELRSAGFSVTTQVRLRHGLVGNYVRGEARHFELSPPATGAELSSR